MPKAEPPTEITEVADVYAAPLAGFIAARDQLRNRLRAEGRDEEAERVGSLRKPSVAVWALNRAARLHPEHVERLLDGHRQIREADSMETMRAASEVRRSAVSALTRAAVAALEAEGRGESPQTRDRINRTLLALATDPESEAELRAGCLPRELEPSGGGWGEISLFPSDVDPGRGAAVAAAEQARSRAERLELEAVDAERLLEIAKRAMTDAKRRAREARRRADHAGDDARRAEEIARGMETG